jgi:hypothetical protein
VTDPIDTDTICLLLCIIEDFSRQLIARVESLSRAAAVTSSSVMALSFFL